MEAIDKFHVGQRVRMTVEATTQGIDRTLPPEKRMGVVQGFPVRGVGDISKLVYVTRTGNRTKQCYHMNFWEPDEEN